MKKLSVFIAVLFFTVSVLFAGKFNTVPIGHEAYRIIEYAEISHIIPVQTKVKPYDYDTIRTLLKQISDYPDLSERNQARISEVIERLDRYYGTKEVKTFGEVLKNGFYRAYDEQHGNSLQIGVKGTMDERLGFDSDKDKIIDARNTGTLYFSGDLFNALSFDMNASLKLDKFCPAAYLTEEFVYDEDGDTFISAGGDHTYIHDFPKMPEGIYLGFKANPEVSLSVFDNRLNLRFGSYARDWGPGIGNLVLSSTAPVFNGLEFQIKPADWFSLTSLMGSLNSTTVYTLYGNERPGAEKGDNGTKSISYDNMFNMQRIELNSEKGFQFGLYESIVWKKRKDRLELAYANPFAIYWFAQSMVGDIDNVAGGADFSFNTKHLGKWYLSVCVDEFTADLKHLITGARNVAALQGGVRFPGNLFGSFTTFTFQATYIPPFYGSHHYQEADDGSWYATSYVNKGFNLFYPLNPDSLEILVNCDMSLKNGWGMSFTARDQMRSAQFALDGSNNGDVNKKKGLTVLDTIYYNEADNYSTKKFFDYIWQNTLAVNATITKECKSLPATFSLGLDGIIDIKRNYETSNKECENTRYNGGKYNLGYDTKFTGKWEPADFRLIGRVMFKLYY